jgi:plastocyanin
MRKIVVLLALTGIVVAGCGSSEKKASTGAGSSASSSSSSAVPSGGASVPVSLPGTTNGGSQGDATSGSIEVKLEDFSIDPTFIKAAPGSKVKVSLKNAGGAPHTFTSTALGVDETLQPGASKDVEVTLPSSGATEFHCKFHQASGMQGAFFSKDGDALAGGSGAGSSSSELSTPYNN